MIKFTRELLKSSDPVAAFVYSLILDNHKNSGPIEPEREQVLNDNKMIKGFTELSYSQFAAEYPDRIFHIGYHWSTIIVEPAIDVDGEATLGGRCDGAIMFEDEEEAKRYIDEIRRTQN